MRNTLELIEVDSDRLDEVVRRAEQSLDEEDAALIRAVFESYAYVTELVEDRNTTIRRLRQLFFGSRSEKTEDVVGSKTGESESKAPPDATSETPSAAGEAVSDESEAADGSKGHGRNGAEAYQGAVRVDVPHPTLHPGDACPACGEGTVYEKTPGVLVRITVSFRQPCKRCRADAGPGCSTANAAGISAFFDQVRARSGGGPHRRWSVHRCSDRSG